MFFQIDNNTFRPIACCRFLRPGGAVLPDLAAMHVAGAGCGALDLDFWTDVHGFSFRFSDLLICP